MAKSPPRKTTKKPDVVVIERPSVPTTEWSEPWATLDQIAAHTGRSRSTIKRAVRAGAIPFTSFGRSLMFKRSRVDAAIEKASKRRRPPAKPGSAPGGSTNK